MYQISTFRDVTITPFRAFDSGGDNTIGGPDWPDWDERSFERLMRSGRLADQRPVPVQDGREAPPKRVDIARAYWSGMIIDHFGHFVAEFCMRILPARMVEPGAKLVFVAKMAQPPTWFWQIIDWCCVPREDVVIIREPTIMRSLSVVGQSEQLRGAAPTPYHLDLMDSFMAQKGLTINKDAPPVYVSRAGLDETNARFAGESYLESCLERAGYLVFRPETARVVDQLLLYVTSPSVSFSEGSALHLCQLAGRSFGRISVLRRRFTKSPFAPSMGPRCRDYVEVAACRHMVMGLDKGGNNEVWRAMALMDLDAVLDDFEGIGGPVRSGFDPDAFRRIEQAELEAWVGANIGHRARENWRESDHAIAAGLREAGFERLAETVLARMDGQEGGRNACR